MGGGRADAKPSQPVSHPPRRPSQSPFQTFVLPSLHHPKLLLLLTLLARSPIITTPAAATRPRKASPTSNLLLLLLLPIMTSSSKATRVSVYVYTRASTAVGCSAAALALAASFSLSAAAACWGLASRQRRRKPMGGHICHMMKQIQKSETATASMLMGEWSGAWYARYMLSAPKPSDMEPRK